MNKIRPRNSLVTEYPALASEWHPTLNGLKTPDLYTIKSREYIWWQCPHNIDHVFRSRISDRVNGDGCPYDSGNKVIPKKSLAANNASLVKEWDFEKNDLLPDEVSSTSLEKYYWKCASGHSWEASVYQRNIQKTQCPFCSGRKATSETSLRALRPDLLKYWDYTNNNSLKCTPDNIKPGSDRCNLFWKCPDCGYAWRDTAAHVSQKKNACSVCSGQAIVSGINSLKDTHPEIMEAWDYDINNLRKIFPDKLSAKNPTKAAWICQKCGHHFTCMIKQYVKNQNCPNCGRHVHGSAPKEKSLSYNRPDVARLWSKDNPMTAEQVSVYSNRIVLWHCSTCNNSWERRVWEQISYNSCPYCNGTWAIPGKTSFAALYPGIAKQLHRESHPKINLDTILPGSGIKLTWKCPDCNRTYQAMIKHRSKGGNCPYCNNQRTREEWNLASNYPLLINEWHTTKNGHLTPNDVSPGSSKKVWWKCSTCNEEYQARVNHMVSNNQNCPICNNRRLRIGFNDLATKCPELINEWSLDNKVKPNQILFNRDMEVIWECSEGHKWVESILKRRYGSKCPYCVKRQTHTSTFNFKADLEDLIIDWATCNVIQPSEIQSNASVLIRWHCHKCNCEWEATTTERRKNPECPFCTGKRPIPGKNSLAALAPDLMSEWDPANTIDPDTIFPNYTKKVKWICSSCETHWEVAPRYRYRGFGLCPNSRDHKD